MKILLVHSKYLPIYNKGNRGAIEKLERIYLEYNELKGDKFTVYSPKVAKDNFDAKKLNNVTFRNVDLFSYKSRIFRAYYALKRRIVKNSNNEYYIRQVIKDIKKRGEENSYDVIIFENEEGSIPLFRKKTNTKTRIVLHLHNDYVNADRHNSKEILDNCDEVWCVSKFIEQRIKALKDVKTVVVSNTVKSLPTADSKEVIKLKKKYNPDKNTIFLYVGRLLEVKGVRELADAFDIYNKENKNAKLIIIGDFGKGNKNEKFAKQMRVKFASNPSIDAVGYKNIAEIANYYKITDAQIIPSKCNEAFGLVVLEAMQGGVRIICSKHGAFREICGDKVLYVSKDNIVEDLIGSMRKISSEGRVAAGYYGDILEKYSVRNFCEAYECALHTKRNGSTRNMKKNWTKRSDSGIYE